MVKQFLLGIDAGGTFTDFLCVEVGVQESLRIHKTLSTPAAPEQAILDGIRSLGLETAIEQGQVQIVHGSTVATNAVLEGKQARTVFVTNRGFADMLQLARQTRPGLYALEFPANEPPVAAELCLETGGRVAADGTTLESLSSEELEELVEKIRALKPEAVAINLLFSFLDDSFEKSIVAAIEDADLGIYVSRSSKVLPVYKEYERGIATWLNASLGPVVGGYLSRLQLRLGNCSLQIMQSSGETMAAEKAAESAVRLLLSGPAGGLAAVKFYGDQTGMNKVISLDMGGTSTDVALLDGAISTTDEGRIAQYPVGVSMVDMHTIGAGGGSIAFVDKGGMLQVGPRSAGAEPGPACYSRGGFEATVTDANLVLGRLLADVSLAGDLKLDKRAATTAIEKVAEQMGLTVEETALGIVAIADEHMAKAIRLISVNRGYDPQDFILASFGGAGGLHVCALADAMGMKKAVVPVHGGVLSALGMVVADRGRQFSRSLGLRNALTSKPNPENDHGGGGIGATDAELESGFADLERQGRHQLAAEGLMASALHCRRSVDVRYVGQSYTLNVPWQDRQQVEQQFQELHQKRYGYTHRARMELVNIRVNVLASANKFPLLEAIEAGGCKKSPESRVYSGSDCQTNSVDDSKIDSQGEQRQEVTRSVARSALTQSQGIRGPAVITEFSATTYLAPDWSARVDRFGNLLLEK